MTTRIVRISFVIAIVLGFASFLSANPAQANIRPLVVSKTMLNKTLVGPNATGNQFATVTSHNDQIVVSLLVTNQEDDITSAVTFRDVFTEIGKTWSNVSGIVVYDGGLQANGSGGCDTTAQTFSQPTDQSPAGSNQRIFSIGGNGGNRIKARHQYCIQYSGNAQANSFPTYKSRLVGYPVYVQDYNTTFDTMYDIAYLYFVPDTAGGNKQVISSLYYSDASNLDLGVIVPGAQVTVTGAGGVVKSITTPSTFALSPNQNSFASAAQGDKQCQLTLNPPYQKNRGGACLFSTTVVVSDPANGNIELGSARAYFMALPSSSIVGNIYAGGNTGLTADKLLLPGTHTVGTAPGATSRTAFSKENIAYSIDNTAVSGWDATSVYKNVYQNVNVQRLVRNPDWVVDASNCATAAVATTFTCSVAANGEYNIRMITAVNKRLNLSNADFNSVVYRPRKDGYVALLKGNLIIDNTNFVNQTTVNNMVTGTIIVQGRLIINNFHICQSSPCLAPGVTGPSLGFIVLGNDLGGAAPAPAVQWSVGAGTGAVPNFGINSYSSNLSSVAFFVPNGTFKAVKTGITTLQLNGTIAANNVDLSNVFPASNVAGQAADAADRSGITIISDQTLASSPPPGFQLFSSSPVLKDLAP